LYQKRLKRLLAYSAISHTGFILLGISCCTIDSVKASLIYIVLYSITSLALFSIILSLGISKKLPKYLINWSSLAKYNMLLASSFSLILFSMAGIPPLAGFFSKLFVLLSLLTQGSVALSVVIVLLSSIGCFYYIRLVKIFFFTTPLKMVSSFYGFSKMVTIFLTILLTMVVFFAVLPNFLINLANLVSAFI